MTFLKTCVNLLQYICSSESRASQVLIPLTVSMAQDTEVSKGDLLDRANSGDGLGREWGHTDSATVTKPEGGDLCLHVKSHLLDSQ